jgi:hypothetical protein
MSNNNDFSVDSAQHAAEDGRLAEWVLDFLASEGSDNAELAAAFAFRGATYLGPIQFELGQLTPMAGPDGDDVVVPVAEEEWEADVAAMKDSVAQGWDPPPLLVSHRDGKFLLEDGNHRFETLRRSGEVNAWAILAFADQEERDCFVNGPETA